MTDTERLAQIRIDAVNSDRAWEDWVHDIQFLIAQLTTAQADAERLREQNAELRAEVKGLRRNSAQLAEGDVVMSREWADAKSAWYSAEEQRDSAQAEAERLRGEKEAAILLWECETNYLQDWIEALTMPKGSE